MYARTEDRDKATTWATRDAQYDAVCTWGIPDHARLQGLSAIDMPVFVANRDSDPMILPRYSHLLAGLIPDARVKIYPDSAHGFLFQHHAEFAADVEPFWPKPANNPAKETHMSVPTENSAGALAVRPFTIPITPEAEIGALRARIAATRWPQNGMV